MKWIALIFIAILIALQYRMWFGPSSFQQIKQQQLKVAQIKAENAKYLNRNQKILAEIKDLRSGTDSIEERARYQLGMIKQGETFFRIIDSRQ